MFRTIKQLFGIYENGHEYWIPLNKIKIRPDFRKTKIGEEKYKRKWNFYLDHGYCESTIKLNKDFLLLDGYSSYVILKIAEGKDTKVPVYFVDSKREKINGR